LLPIAGGAFSFAADAMEWGRVQTVQSPYKLRNYCKRSINFSALSAEKHIGSCFVRAIPRPACHSCFSVQQFCSALKRRVQSSADLLRFEMMRTKLSNFAPV
jgi:hypothetical protein